ncbi:MAG TPA: ParB/RepB/Spo0J family partition protein [Candidatus Polarisedimenticolia bacterium]|nr:ParB/RepB/Spo0J family partition protein [Candidatus Polarisedimenticolia bacterium]
MNGKRRALGRGLSTLIPEVPVEAREGLFMLDVGKIVPNRVQPRTRIEGLEGLAASIKENGIIQPVIVTESKGEYQLVAGERRWRAAKLAGVARIPAILKHVSDDRRLELALVENIQRQELNPLEEAKAYELLLSDLQLTQIEVARRVGKERSTIANQLRLLKLPEEVQAMLADGTLDGGHARALLSLPDAAKQVEVAEKVAREFLSVRETENLVRRMLEPSGPSPHRQATPPDPNVQSAEDRLARSLGTKVRIVPSRKKGVGKIEIEYYSEEELDRLFSLLITRGP